jgi:hypothetical protein
VGVVNVDVKGKQVSRAPHLFLSNSQFGVLIFVVSRSVRWRHPKKVFWSFVSLRWSILHRAQE